MMASRGMGAMSEAKIPKGRRGEADDTDPTKMPKGRRKERRDDTDFTQYKEGGKVGLYANINAKRKRGEKMRKPGAPGAPTKQDFINSAKTAKGKK